MAEQTDLYTDTAERLADEIRSGREVGESGVEGVSDTHLRNIRRNASEEAVTDLETAIDEARPPRRSEMSDKERAEYVREHGKDEYLNLPE